MVEYLSKCLTINGDFNVEHLADTKAHRNSAFWNPLGLIPQITLISVVLVGIK